MASGHSAKQDSGCAAGHGVNHIEYLWMRRQDKSTVKLPDYSEVSALLSWAPRGESEAHNLIARHKPPSRSLQKLLVWASVGVLLFSSIGCSRDVQHAEDNGKKIDLTLPAPQVRVQAAEKPADKVDASTEEKAVKKKVESASATAQDGVTRPITRQPEVAPVNGGHVKKQARRTPAKKRDSAAINPQRPPTASMRRDGVGKGVDPKQQDSRASEETKPYQDSGNPLHPSYRKK